MCIQGQQKLFVMNLMTDEIFTVDDWSVSDNVLKAQNQEYIPTEFVWFYSKEDAEQFINEKKNFNFIELVFFTKYGTMIYCNTDEEVVYLYYGTPVAFCENCDRLLIDDDIHYMDNDQRSEVCEDCFENCDTCSLCGRVMDEDDIRHYDGYCSDCY